MSIPDERDEAMRDLSRARVDAVRARLKARQQLKALLLRHGRRYTGKTSWNAAHERYLATMSFCHRSQDIALVEYRQAVSEAQARVERLSQALGQELEHWRMRRLVQALMMLRGVDQLVATTLVAELGELRRFAHPRELMGYLGLVPSEHTSGDKRRPVAEASRATARRHPRYRLARAAAREPSLPATERAPRAVRFRLAVSSANIDVQMAARLRFSWLALHRQKKPAEAGL